MAEIVSFTKSLNRTRGHALDSFVDDGDLLEFFRPEDAQTQAHNKTQTQTNSLFASDWSNQELADLYRAYSLVQSAQPGLECDRGISDEGDPWFLIGDAKGDVLVHICRIQGTYILDSVALSKALRGANFNALIEDFLTSVVGEQAQEAEAAHEPANVIQLARGGSVYLHPSMMIAALVWTLLMNADELSLPAANDTSQKGLDQGQDIDQAGDQDSIPPGDLPGDDLAYSDLFQDNPGSGTVDSFSEPSTAAMISQIAQRDEKQLHVSAYSQALTMIAIAAGFYTSAEVADVFWKSAPAPAGTSVSFGETQTSEVHDQITPLDYVSDALALLSSVVDLAVFESQEDYAAEDRSAGEENTNALIPAATEAIEASIGQQMLTMASEAVSNLTEASLTKTIDASGKGNEEANTMQSDLAASLYDKGLALNAQETALATSIQGIAQAYASGDADVNRYDASSFKAGLGKFDGELDKYSDILGGFFSFSGADLKSARSSDTAEPSSDSSSFKSFDETARNFVDYKMANADLEMLVFANEIIFVDTAAFSANNTAVSWQLEDGGVISMIGLSSEMEEFLVA